MDESELELFGVFLNHDNKLLDQTLEWLMLFLLFTFLNEISDVVHVDKAAHLVVVQ